MADKHQQFLEAIRQRQLAGGAGEISTADRTAGAALECFEDACKRYLPNGLDRAAAVKHAEGVATYFGERFAIEEKATNVNRFKEILPEGIEIPAHTQMVIVNTLTTPREDRDKDVMKTEGAVVDPNMPLLWQHIPGLPMGKMIAVLDHDASVLRLATALLDLNDLTTDAAKLFEAGVLRFSQGFRTLEFSERKARPDDIAGPPGFEIRRFEVLEESAVSVPSNIDAVVEMFAKGALASDPMKVWGKRLFDSRKKSFPGYTPPAAAAKDPAPAPCTGKAKTAPTTRKLFDVSTERLEPASVEIDWAARYLGVAVKDVYVESTGAAGPMRGGFMKSLETVLHGSGSWVITDTRNLGEDGEERPPIHETVQIKSTERRTFLVSGLRFVSHPDGRKLVYRTFKSWHGQDYLFYAADAKTAHEVIDGAWEELDRNNPLKGEAFSLAGGFIDRKGTQWEDVFLEEPVEKALKRTVKIINEKGGAAANRGIVMMGPPGTGKTLSGRVMLNEAKATFIWISAKDFYKTGSYYAFSGALELARKLAPAIVLYEDVDNWIDKYTVDLLKGELDGLVQNSGVVTVITTNFPDKLPAALIDRPGRFHDVLEVHLPTKDVRVRMLSKWAEGATPDAIRKMADETEGYSGAHLFELTRFASVLADEDEIDLDAALSKAFAKIKEQRELIDDAQLSGSSYRPSRREAGPDAVKRIAAEWRHAAEETPSGEKAGRVLSAKNLKALKEVRDDLADMAGMDKMPRGGVAMCERCTRKLDDVIKSQDKPGDGPADKPDDEEKPGKTATARELAAFALAAADGPEELKAFVAAAEAAIAAHEAVALATEIEQAEAALAPA